MNLSDALIGLLGAIVSLVALALGVLMAVSPSRFIALGVSVGRLMGFPKTDIHWDGSRRREWQVSGCLVAGTSLIIAVFAFQVLLSAPQSVHMVTIQETSSHSGGDLNSLFSGLVMFALGLFTIIRARAIYLWMRARSGFVSSHGSTSQQVGTLIFRLVGLVWLLGALIAIWKYIAIV